MPELDLLDKTEIWLVGVRLTDVDLSALAKAAAGALSLPADAVFVTDVRDDHVVFDVVVPKVRMEDIIGRERELLSAIDAVEGVELTLEAGVHSHGVLGILGAPQEQVESVVHAATTLEANLRAYIARRVAVVSTGAEVVSGDIQDTNVETIRRYFSDAGFDVISGGVVVDDERKIAGLVSRLVEEGYGLIITTGGVGAEDKDRTIEALELLDPEISTAILATYQVGHGRHVKPHVRVACGKIGETMLVALPGPTREVNAAMPVLLQMLSDPGPTIAVAEAIAVPIRELWRTNFLSHTSG